MTFRPLFLVGLVSTVGCHPTPATRARALAPAPLPSGWTRAEDREDGVSLGVAPGWREGASGGTGDALGLAQNMPGSDLGTGDPNSDPNAALQARMAAEDRRQEQKELAELRAKGTLLQIIDGSKPIPGEARTRYYVKRVKHDGNVTLDEAVDDEKARLRGIETKTRAVKLPIGDAVRFECEAKTVGGDQVNQIVYVTVDGPNAYYLRFIATNNPTVLPPIADSVAQTLRIKPSAG